MLKNYKSENVLASRVRITNPPHHNAMLPVCPLTLHGPIPKGHKNSQLPSMAVSFSPCLRYLGVGSEDKQAYLYDMRQGVVAHKVGRGAVTEAVTGVAWNPLHPQMALSCLDGKVHFFSDGSS
jgi:hypothetical protein